MARFAVLLAPLCACTIIPDGDGACDGHPGLHVVVDISSTACQLISPDGANWTIEATLSNGALDKQHAVRVRSLFDPRRIDYVWTWPAGTADGFAGEITWTGNGNGNTAGYAQAPYVVHAHECETIELAASCTYGFDAGP